MAPGFPALLILAFGPLALHGEVSDRIERLAREIAGHPHQISLRLKRADLLLRHGDSEAARADLLAVEQINPGAPGLEVAWTELFLMRGDALRALPHAERAAHTAVTREARQAQRLRATALDALGRHARARDAWTLAIAAEGPLDPDLYAARAASGRALGPDQVASVLRGIDEGLAVLGPLPQLLAPAIELELERGEIDAALERVDRLYSTSPRRETHLLRRGEILLLAGREQEARCDLLAAKTALAGLSPVRRRSAAVEDLSRRVERLLGELQPAPCDS